MKQFWKENAYSLLLKPLSKAYFKQSRVKLTINSQIGKKTAYKKDFQKYHWEEHHSTFQTYLKEKDFNKLYLFEFAMN